MTSATPTSPLRCMLFGPMDLYTCNYKPLTPSSPAASSVSPSNSGTRCRDLGCLKGDLVSKDQGKEGTRYFRFFFATRSPNLFRSRSTLYLVFLLVHCRCRSASSYPSHPTLSFNCSYVMIFPNSTNWYSIYNARKCLEKGNKNGQN